MSKVISSPIMRTYVQQGDSAMVKFVIPCEETCSKEESGNYKVLSGALSVAGLETGESGFG